MRARRPWFPFLAFTASLWLASPAAAQGRGTVAGRVLDAETGGPVSGAHIQVLGAADPGAGGVLSDVSGRFRLSLPAGTYSLVVVNVGYETARTDGVSVSGGGTTDVEIVLTSRALALNPIVVSVGRGREEKALDAPASVSVVTAERIRERAAVTPVEYVKALPGVDVVQTGLTQSNTVTRGFNNVFSGSMLVLSDNRYAQVPSLRLNAYNMIQATPLDIERVEVLLGPASALYGPNASSGVMHIITTSPIDAPGRTVSLSGGGRDVFHGAFRQAWAFSERAGFKVSGQYMRGDDWKFRDPVEVRARADAQAELLLGNPAADTSAVRIGDRDFDSERWGGEARLDLRPWDDGEVIFAYGINQLVSSIELTGLGAGQADDWRYQFGQARLRKGRLFAQAFLNKSDAGDTRLLRTGQDITDESEFFGGQVQYGLLVKDKVDVLAGVDLQRTVPKTSGTITGLNEGDDEIDEIGGYVHTTTALSSKLDLVAALRLDDHSELDDVNVSPRAALVFEPAPGHNLRFTFNRAFATPTTNNLFLDLVAGRIPLPIPNPAGGTFGFDVRTEGVPSTGFTFDDRCPGGVQERCMYSPFAPGQKLPANGALLWDQVLVPAALANPQLQGVLQQVGLSPAQFAQIVGRPEAGALDSWLLRFNQENLETPFLPDPGPTALQRLQETTTDTWEVGYKGIFGDRLAVSADVYFSKIEDFIGPLRVETPTVFLRGESIATFLTGRLVGVGFPLQQAQQLAGSLASSLAQLPLGTVAPDQRSDSDVILTYRNFGDVDLWGMDLGFQLFATDRVSLTGAFSYVSEECFDFNDDGSCTSAVDVSLNAPQVKGSFGARFQDEVRGYSVEGRMRYSDGFIMNSGVFLGNVDNYAVFDANVGYRLPWAPGARASLTVTNLFDNDHREFVGAPELGRLALLKIEYAF